MWKVDASRGADKMTVVRTSNLSKHIDLLQCMLIVEETVCTVLCTGSMDRSIQFWTVPKGEIEDIDGKNSSFGNKLPQPKVHFDGSFSSSFIFYLPPQMPTC